MKRIKALRLAAAAAVLAAVLALGAAAAPRTPKVVRDGSAYTGAVRLKNGTTYVRLREFAESLGGDVTWDGKTGVAGVSAPSLTVSAKNGSSYILANGRALICPENVFIEDGRTYVSLRAIGAAFGYETGWNADTFTASLKRVRSAIVPDYEYYDSEDLYWLSRIVSAEARGEVLAGKLAVATVVMNRVRSDSFPNSVYGVIFDRAGGVQFTPVANGTIYRSPDSESVIAAKLCLEGGSVNGDILFFLNARLAESFWITQNRRYVMTVGNHDFYA